MDKPWYLYLYTCWSTEALRTARQGGAHLSTPCCMDRHAHSSNGQLRLSVVLNRAKWPADTAHRLPGIQPPLNALDQSMPHPSGCPTSLLVNRLYSLLGLPCHISRRLKAPKAQPEYLLIRGSACLYDTHRSSGIKVVVLVSIDYSVR
jgi:hypothetical protein